MDVKTWKHSPLLYDEVTVLCSSTTYVFTPGPNRSMGHFSVAHRLFLKMQIIKQKNTNKKRMKNKDQSYGCALVKIHVDSDGRPPLRREQ